MPDVGHLVLHQLPGQRVDLGVEVVCIVEVTENYQLSEGGEREGEGGRRERGRGREGERQQSFEFQVQTGIGTTLRLEWDVHMWKQVTGTRTLRQCFCISSSFHFQHPVAR